MFTCSFTRVVLCVCGVVAPARNGSRPSPLCLLTSRVWWTQQGIASREPRTRFVDVVRGERASRKDSTLFRELVLSRTLAKFSAVILFFPSFCAIILCTVPFCGALQASLRQSSILCFSTSKITYSPSCQKVGKYFCFSYYFVLLWIYALVFTLCINITRNLLRGMFFIKLLSLCIISIYLIVNSTL